jgi:hypothetical protein
VDRCFAVLVGLRAGQLIPLMASQALLDARTAVARQLGLAGFDTSDADAQRAAYRELSAADQIRFTDALSAYVYTNPDAFTTDQLAVANDRVTSPYYNTPLADTSLAAAASEFIDEAGKNATGIFAGLSGLTKTLAVIAVAVAVIYLVREFKPGQYLKKAAG